MFESINPATGHLIKQYPAMSAAMLTAALKDARSAATAWARVDVSVRASMLEQYGQDYVVTARAKGLTERRITFVHVLRNALLPVVTMAGVQVGALIGGSVIVESVFAWPGLGMLAFESLFARDLNLLLGIFLLSSALVVAVNLIVDVIYCFLDPRIEVN